MSDIQLRKQYRPDGRMRWSRLPVLVLFPLLVAVAGAILLNVLFVVGWYFVLIVPMAVGALVASSVYLGVHWSHCRKPWLAMMIGLAMGLVTYLGYFHVGMVTTFGMPAHRVDLLPWYVKFRMATDVQQDAGRPNQGPAKPDLFMNWFTFLYELAIIAGMSAEVARRHAMRGYDPKHQCWLKKELIVFPLGTLDALTKALETNQTAEFCQTHRVTGDNPQASCQTTLEYTCSDEVSPLECPIYLTATEHPVRSELGAIFRRSKMLIQREITREEALDFQSQFTVFDQTLRERHRELRDLPISVSGTDPDAQTATTVAVIQPINEQDRTNVFSGWNLLIENVIGGLMLVGFFGGMGVIYAGVHFNPAIGLAGSVAIGAIGALMIGVSAYVALVCPTAPETVYSRWLMRRCLQQRAGVWVRPDDPDAIFVCLSQRDRWSKVKLETMTDAGYALIDRSAQTLRLECDAERMKIDRSSVIDCQAELFKHPIDQQTEHWMIRLVIQVSEGQREILITDATPRWTRYSNAMRQMRANELAGQIRSM